MKFNYRVGQEIRLEGEKGQVTEVYTVLHYGYTTAEIARFRAMENFAPEITMVLIETDMDEYAYPAAYLDQLRAKGEVELEGDN